MSKLYDFHEERRVNLAHDIVEAQENLNYFLKQYRRLGYVHVETTEEDTQIKVQVDEME